jgi:NB-ARC domain
VLNSFVSELIFRLSTGEVPGELSEGSQTMLSAALRGDEALPEAFISTLSRRLPPSRPPRPTPEREADDGYDDGGHHDGRDEEAEYVRGSEPGERVTPQEARHRRALRAKAAILYGLPGRDEPVVGRAGLITEVAEKISAHMRSHGSAAAFLSGQPGVGSSTVAVEVARALAGDFPGGVVHINLHGLEPGLRVDGRTLVDLVCETVGIRLRTRGNSEAELFELLVAQLAERHVLLVFDNAADSAHVSRLARLPSTCAAIVTSRDQDQDYATPGLVFRVDTLSPADAVEVLAYYTAGRTRQETVLGRIGQLCDRLPLALRLVGAYIAARPQLDLERYANRLEDERTRLNYLQAGERALRAVIALSYDALDPAAQRLCRLITALPGAMATSTELGHCLETPPAEAELGLNRLVDRSLAHEALQADPDHAGFAAFTLYELVRLFAQEKLLAQEPAQEVGQIQLRSVAFLAGQLKRIVERAEDADLSAELDPTRFHAAESMAEASGWTDVAMELALGLYELYASRGDYGGASVAHDMRLALLSRGGQYEQSVLACLNHANLLRRMKAGTQAVDAARRGLTIAQRHRLRERMVEANQLISVLLSEIGEWPAALEAGERAAHMLLNWGQHEAAIPLAINNIRLAVTMLHPAKALHWAEVATRLADDVGDEVQQADAAMERCRAQLIAGEYHASIISARRGADLWAARNTWLHAAVAMSNGATSAMLLGDLDEEVTLRRASAEYWERVPLELEEYLPFAVQSLIDLSAAQTRSDLVDTAQETLGRAAAMARRHQPKRLVSATLRLEAETRWAAARQVLNLPTRRLRDHQIPQVLAQAEEQSTALHLDPELIRIANLLQQRTPITGADAMKEELLALLRRNTIHPPDFWSNWLYESVGDFQLDGPASAEYFPSELVRQPPIAS